MATSHVFMLSLRIFTVLLGYTRLSSGWHSHRLLCTLRPPPASTFAPAHYCCWQIAVGRGSSHAQCSVLFHCSALLLSTRDAHMLTYRVWDRHREANGSFCHCDCHSVLLMLHKDRREVTWGWWRLDPHMCSHWSWNRGVAVSKGRDCQSLVPKNLDLGKFKLKSVCVNSF